MAGPAASGAESTSKGEKTTCSLLPSRKDCVAHQLEMGEIMLNRFCQLLLKQANGVEGLFGAGHFYKVVLGRVLTLRGAVPAV